uniref:RdRp catalytic domain-containing protein n=1 Tax=Trichuris muris TaxID=70415 RepID=A0A5S6QZW2_TRIMR
MDHNILRLIYACLVREFWTNRIAQLYVRRQLNWIESDGRTELDDWSQVFVLKNFDFDYCLDYTQILDDKAISTYKSHWDQVYDPTLLGYRPEQGTESRRVMLEVLARHDIDIKRMMEVVMKREVPDDWKVVGVRSKERELKTAPRLFAMMPLEMRIYFCVTERNIASTVFRYFPQQTMTQTEADLTQRLLRITEQRTAKRNVLPVIININFEKWNLNWRQESMCGTLEFLDNLFGTPGLFSYTHEFFSSALFYLVFRYCVPAGITKENPMCPPESSTVWYENGSGKEGIPQKGWTLATVGALLLVESLTGVFGTITGQGNNQVIVAMFEIPSTHTRESYVKTEPLEIKKRVDACMTKLSFVFNSIGLPVKKEESWVPPDVFAYGKDILYKDNRLDPSYPLPTVTELLATLAGGVLFSKLDLSQAYQQLKMRRLPFGIDVAPSIFQRFMDTCLAELDGVKAYLDDVLIMGRSEAENWDG